ncbi:MAG: phosphatidate cytidylyltransferase [Bacteroidales bacterium]|nr:phosphatidate cytidylyltransferase [Bacteroidales bacterium]
MNNFVKRAITGAGIVIFCLGGFWLHPLSFFISGIVILAGTQWEYYMLIKKSGALPQVIPGMLMSVSAYILSTLAAAGLLEIKYIATLAVFPLIAMIAELYNKNKKPFDSLAHTFFPVFYTGLPFYLFPFAAFSHTGLSSLLPYSGEAFSPGIIIGFFILIWANDTGAYLAGRIFGRHKLFERISPRKTWEGFIGGLIFTVVASWLLSGWLGVVSGFYWAVIAVIVSTAGTYGDLVESMLKRSVGVKDSGNIMPGHGGFLDRFDSAIAAFPAIYLFILLFVH